jgi:DNA-binding beta-propeller fold protein YncE
MSDLRELLDRAGSDADASVMLPAAAVRHLAARRRRRQAVLAACATAALLVLVIGLAAWLGPTLFRKPGPTSPTPSPMTPSLTVPLGAGALTVDKASGTLYAAAGGVTVLSTATCNVDDQSGCRRALPAIPGNNAQVVAVSPVVHSIYVAQWSNSVAVFDVASCAGVDTSGCSARGATFPVGVHPQAIAVDTASNTVYVANWGNQDGRSVSVIDGATCNAGITTGCRPVASITVPAAPDALLVDASSHTLYVRSTPQGLKTTVQVVNTSTCNGRVTSGCRPEASVALGQGWSTGSPNALAVDDATHTLYATNYTDSTLSMLDIGACNAGNVTGCSHARTATVGDGPTAVAVDPTTHTVYVTNYTDATLTVLDGVDCNASRTAGCRAGRTLATGAGPVAVAVDPTVHTVYVANSFDSDLTLLAARR